MFVQVELFDKIDYREEKLVKFKKIWCFSSKDIYMSYLLHLNDDFDDDLLM